MSSLNKIIFLVLVYVFIATTSIAQCPVRTYSNNWDWTTEDYEAFIRTNNTYENITLKSPFYTPDNSNVYHFSSQPFQKKDFHPDDGWVLIRKSFGEPGGFANAVSNPYFILYNKHTGILRIFCAVTEQHDDYSGAVITFNFIESDKKESALFSHFQPITQPLNNFIKKVHLKAPSNFSNQVGYWVYADFVMAYDPCTCYHITNLEAKIYLLKKSGFSFDLFGDMNQVVNSGTPASNDFNTIVNYLNNAFESGNKVYKSTESVVNNLTKLLNKQNSDEKSKMSNSLYDLKNFLSYVPKIGQLIGVVDFFVGGGNKVNKTNITTTAFEANLKGVGSISDSSIVSECSFTTPGSNNLGQDPSAIPIYNNVLGIFNLLESPILEYVDYSQWENFYIDQNGQEQYPVLPEIRQFKVKEDIKYVVNPASGLEVESIEAALIIKYIPANKPVDIYGITTTPKPVEFEDPQFQTLQTYKERLNKIGIQVESWTDNSITNGDYRLRTPYLPIGCFNAQSFILYKSGMMPDIYCKVNVVLKRTDEPNAQKVTFIASYPVKIVASPLDANDNYYHWQVSQNWLLYPTSLQSFNNPTGPAMDMPFKNIPYDLDLHSTTFSGTTTYQAWHDITIGPLSSFDPGSNITFIAGNQVNITPGTEIPAGTIIKIDAPDICNRQINPSTVDESYCKYSLSKYNPNVASVIPTLVNNPQALTFSLYPNPASSSINADISMPENSFYNIRFINSSGKVIKAESRFALKGENKEYFEISKLLPGVYTVQLISGDFVRYAKLVVVK